MEDGFGAIHGFPHCVGVADIGAGEGDQRGMPLPQPGQVGLDARTNQRIEDQHGVALAGQPVGQLATDEAGTACHQDGATPAGP